MDLNDIWQEHKTWIVGVLGGLIVFLVANSWISNKFATRNYEKRIRQANATLKRSRFYGAPARRAATADRAAIDADLARVEALTYFRVRPQFSLEGKGDPTMHYLQTTTSVRSWIQADMDTASVEFTPVQLGLPAQSPVQREDTRRILIALDAVDDLLTRLLVASSDVQRDAPEALGLRAVDKIQIEASRVRRRGGSRARRKKTVQLGERISARLRFHVGGETLQRFLEACVGESRQGHDAVRPLLIDEIKAVTSERPGDPMQVDCRVLALIHPPKTDA